MLIYRVSDASSTMLTPSRTWPAVLCVLLVAGCGGGDSDTGASPGSTTATSASTPPPVAPLSIGTFARKELDAANIEGIGCRLRTKDSAQEAVFFSGEDGGFMVIDGKPVLLDTSSKTLPTVVEIADSYTKADYTVRLLDVSEQRRTSIESTERDATVNVVARDGRTTSISGVLGCGV